jgi:hypothetical protein
MRTSLMVQSRGDDNVKVHLKYDTIHSTIVHLQYNHWQQERTMDHQYSGLALTAHCQMLSQQMPCRTQLCLQRLQGIGRQGQETEPSLVQL